MKKVNKEQLISKIEEVEALDGHMTYNELVYTLDVSYYEALQQHVGYYIDIHLNKLSTLMPSNKTLFEVVDRSLREIENKYLL